jgi:hypothetical protein
LVLLIVTAVKYVKATGRAVDQAVNFQLHTAEARFDPGESCGIYGGQSGTRAGIFCVLRFLLSITNFTDYFTIIIIIIYPPGLVQ